MMVASSSRELVRRVFSGREVSRLPIILHFGAYAARLNQLTYQQMCADPTLLANSLQSAQRLFGCDGLVILLDPTIEAEACGCHVAWMGDEPVIASHPLAESCGSQPLDALERVEVSGRLAVALEATRRLKLVVGKEVAILGAVTGPMTLAYHLRGEAIKSDLASAPDTALAVVDLAAQVTLQIARRYLDIGVDVLLIADPLLGELGRQHYPRLREALRQIWNVVEFFDVHSLLLTRLTAVEKITDILSLGSSGLSLDGTLPHEAIVEQATRCNQCFGVNLSPFIADDGQLSSLPMVLAQHIGKGRISRTFAACWQIPRATPPELVHQLCQALRN